mmetsp:Transcript_46920/g.123132  ORF Transcript_46920/g.123132 Transcript_46920/m.123132 type:complete len:107 (-) Transcript_46920:125-445(-)
MRMGACPGLQRGQAYWSHACASTIGLLPVLHASSTASKDHAARFLVSTRSAAQCTRYTSTARPTAHAHTARTFERSPEGRTPGGPDPAQAQSAAKPRGMPAALLRR